MMVSTKDKHWMSVESVSERAWVKEEGVSSLSSLQQWSGGFE